ncbi:protein disulfide-isomerase A3 [Fopius arisanus]|uniref:Protein disulfide-isomerase n=2 Tax=Fopius arisanus TaxID=64838 RepID=A0A9R1T4I8_9HYME|nr:PREDICTED: protein disulfide-isomerase A3 [Fopius arisanus]
MLTKCFLLCLLALGAYAGEEDVLDLGDDDFTSKLDQHENTLVMFYAPWCGHCKRLKPEYAKAAELLRGNDPPITLAKVDCTEAGKDTCTKFGVSGYPTLKIFSRSEMVSEYNGPREAPGIVKFMQSQVGPASKELKGDDCHKAFLTTDEVSLIGYFEKESSALSTAFQAVAKKLREKVRFAHTYAKSLIEKEGLTDHIVLYRPKALQNKFEPNTVKFEGKDSIADINDFIAKNYFGLVGVRTRDNAGQFENPLVVAYYAVDYVKNPKGTNYWRNRVIKIGKEFPEVNFAISNKDDFQHELNDFGIEFAKGEKPVVLARDAKNQKFILKDEFSVESLEKFVKDFVAGKLEPFLKSEPIPEDNSGNVKVAVAKNFEELISNADSDILIEFYAPWCGHCKKLAPIFDELGDKLAKEDVIIAKMDATANDVPPQFEVRGFPTLFWIPKNSKDSPVKYEGGRELEDFVKYIAKHSTESLKGYDRKGNPVKTPSDEL